MVQQILPAAQHMHRASILSKIGATAYVIWAVLHFRAAWTIYELGNTVPDSMVQGRLMQAAWHLLWFSIIALAIAVTLNWRNDPRGWWMNLIVVSIVDVGFILFVLVPGYVPMWPGLAGPVFWLIGLLYSTLALRADDAKTERSVR